MMITTPPLTGQQSTLCTLNDPAAEYNCSLWDANEDDIMSESEVRDLAAEWDMSFEDVLEQLEEV